MTKDEFAQRVAIALAGNPNFGTQIGFSYADIVHKADKLADYFEKESKHGYFD